MMVSKIFKILLIINIVIPALTLYADNSSFKLHNLKYGVSVKIHKNWVIKNTEALYGNPQGGYEKLIEANYYGNNSKSVAIFIVDILHKTTLNRRKLDKMSFEDMGFDLIAEKKALEKIFKERLNPYIVVEALMMDKEYINGMVSLAKAYAVRKVTPDGYSGTTNNLSYTIPLDRKQIRIRIICDGPKFKKLLQTFRYMTKSISIK